MVLAYDPSNRRISRVQYFVNTEDDRLYIPTTGSGDNPDSGSTAQQLAQCELNVGLNAAGDANLAEGVVSS